eukprot:PITA_22254
MLKTHDSLFILVLYVDDLLVTGSSTSAIATVKRALHDRFLMTYMGPLHFFLSLEISQDATGIKLSKAMYARDLLEGFCMTDYSDWAGDIIDRKSTSGYSLSLGYGPICWSRKKQATISLSSAEVEYKGVVHITIQALWLQHFLTELGIQFH